MSIKWDEPEEEKKVKLSRAERGQVRRAATRLMTVEHLTEESESHPGRWYRAVILADGKTMCDCRGWTIRRHGRPRECRHTRKLIGDRLTVVRDGHLYLLKKEG